MTMKKIVGRDVLISYPNYSEEYIINIDANKNNLRGIIIQNGKPISSYSRKLTPAEVNCTAIEREPLRMVKTLTQFRIILLGHRITVYTEQHKEFFSGTCCWKNMNLISSILKVLIMMQWTP